MVLTLLLSLVAPATAQEPRDTLPADTVPADTLERDTLLVPIPPNEVEGDTLPRDTTLETEEAVAVHAFPLWPDPQPEGWAYGRWEWDREELLRHHGLSLLELLERVPALVITRAGGFGRPAGVTAWGLGGGRVRVFLDGYELDPLAAASPDLQQIGLVDLAAVRVERSLLGIRIELSTFRLDRATPFAQVEVGTGADDINLLRALFARPWGSRSLVTASGGLVSTDGIGISEPFKVSSLNLGWSYALSDDAAVQLEYRTDAVEREAREQDIAYAADFARRDVILRARGRILPALAVDAMVGRSSRDADAAEDSLDADFGVVQAAARAAYEHRLGWLEGAARYRGAQTGSALPRIELSARAVARPLARLTVEAELRQAELDGVGATELRGVGRLGVAGGLSLYAEAAAGTRLTSLLRTAVDTLVTVVVDTAGVEAADTSRIRRYLFPRVSAEAAGTRLGAAWSGWGGVDLAASALRLGAADAVPFGLALDAPLDAFETEAVTGIELAWNVPLPVLDRAVRLVGWYNRWSDVGGRPYLPREQAQVGLHFTDVYAGGQFEPTLRLDLLRRGSAIVPALGAQGELGLGASEAYNLVNLFLQLRILDVRAFLLWENLLGTAGVRDLADDFQRRPMVVYGVRWHFWN